nr:hypothetical protein [Megavirus caiporensis]
MDDFLLFIGKPGVYQTTRPKTGYKKIRCFNYRDSLPLNFSEIDAIAELEIPVDSTIVKTRTSKLRTNQAIVKSIKFICDDSVVDESFVDESFVCYSVWDRSFIYRTGKKVSPKNEGLNLDPDNSCGSGINFFNSKKEAINFRFT